MDIVGTIGVFITIVATISGVIIALLQLQGGRRDAQAARMADLSWQIYQTYETEEIRGGRRAIETVSHDHPIPQTAEDYGKTYVLYSYEGKDKEEVHDRAKRVRGKVRTMLRFYHQVGILLEKKMIDPDFVFPLIGDGLETSEHGIRVATDWYQTYYAGHSLHEKAEVKRNIYGNAPRLCQEYRNWKRNRVKFE